MAVLTLDHYAPLHLALSYSTPKSFPSLLEFFATFYSYSFTSKHFIPTETSQLTMHTSHLSNSDNVITVEEWDRHKDTIKNLFVSQRHTLPELKRIMERDYGFRATYV
jgi:hypothetical protein